MATITVVTAITGNKDKLQSQPKYDDVAYVAFMDEPAKDPLWEVRRACSKFVSPVMNAKIHKILTHKYVGSPIIVWMDGNFILKHDPHELVKIMGDKNFAFFQHHARKTIYREISVCLKVRRGNPEELIEQRDAYLKMGIPPKTGMAECPAFIRKNNPEANAAFERWWAEITRYSSRDQVSFPVAFRGYEWATIPGKIFSPEKDENDFFEYTKHL